MYMGVNLSKFRIRVLKMDCKGCEYNVISETDALRLFDIIEIEYGGHLVHPHCELKPYI